MTQSHRPLNNNFPITIMSKMHICIDSLLDIGAIRKCQPCESQYLSKIFIIPKQDGSSRFILNLKKFNNFVKKSHFKMEDIRTVLKLLNHDCFMATIDLKDAYFLVKMNENSQKYLRFLFNKEMYEFKVLPFGLSSAPYVFTKLIRPILAHLRLQGVTIINYLDDFIIISESKQTCKDNVALVCKFLLSLGFIINYEKSQLSPRMKCRFLGFELDSHDFTISIPEDKKINILYSLKSFCRRKFCSVREFASLLGTLTSICPASPYGWMHTKELERSKYLKLLKNNDNYEAKMKINQRIIQELQWWIQTIPSVSNPIRRGNYNLELFSDASQTGWGIVCGNQRLHGFWDDNEKKFHINYLELLSVYFALKCFTKENLNCEILIRTDNTTVISYINRMGGIQFPYLNNLTRKIWQYCEVRNNYLFASYIPSKENIEADFQSRITNIETEWELAHYAYNMITSKFSVPEIDLFASRINKKCEKFVSWHVEPNSWSVDAFTISWTNLKFYAFPPFSMILKCLQKIQQDKAEGIVVVPDWPSQAWYPLFMSLLRSELVCLSPNPKLLLSPFRTPHPLHQSLTLIAGMLSAKFT